MARPVVLSNGEMHVGLNRYGLVHDFYYPYVGQENHTAAKHLRHRVGVWVDGQLSWLDDKTWDVKIAYHNDVLVSRITVTHSGLQVAIEFDDFVDSSSNSFMRNIHVINHGDNERDIKLYLHQVFVISDSYGSDTVQYLPDEQAILHYKGHRSFIVGGAHHDGRPIDQYSVGLFGIEGHDGTYRDAEDGELSGNPVEHGRVDSVMGLVFHIKAHSSARCSYWIAAGTLLREARHIHRRIQKNGVLHYLLKTTLYWRHWTKPLKTISERLDGPYAKAFIRSGQLLKSHQDKHGAVIASCDTTMLNYERDSYAYCWPRDGAYVMWPLVRLGYREEPLHFFNFIRRVMHEDGYVMHKYQPDGTVGASWHPYVHDNANIAPIQEDETAIVVFLFGQYYSTHQDRSLLDAYYPTMVKPMANFLAGYIDEDTHLPKPSYDLWEEQFMTTTYTTAVVHAALCEAAVLADVLGDTEASVRWQTVADDMKEAAATRLYDYDRQYFYKGLRRVGGELAADDTVDTASFFGSFMFGLFDVSSDHMQKAYQTLLKTLVADGPGIPRYERDSYHRINDAAPSNGWFITALWHAQYLIEIDQIDQAKSIIDWVLDHALSTGVLSEQVLPDGSQTSVAPLTWSHAELVSTLLDLAMTKKPTSSYEKRDLDEKTNPANRP